jgi:hypothetical protein
MTANNATNANQSPDAKPTRLKVLTFNGKGLVCPGLTMPVYQFISMKEEADVIIVLIDNEQAAEAERKFNLMVENQDWLCMPSQPFGDDAMAMPVAKTQLGKDVLLAKLTADDNVQVA